MIWIISVILSPCFLMSQGTWAWQFRTNGILRKYIMIFLDFQKKTHSYFHLTNHSKKIQVMHSLCTPDKCLQHSHCLPTFDFNTLSFNVWFQNDIVNTICDKGIPSQKKITNKKKYRLIFFLLPKDKEIQVITAWSKVMYFSSIKS